MAYYILDNNNNLKEVPVWKTHNDWFEENRKRWQIGFNHLPNGLKVSTIFLKTSPKMDNEKLLFETMIFGDCFLFDTSEFPINYYTYEEALKGHLAIINSELCNLVGSMEQTSKALSEKALEIQNKYEKCIAIINRFDAGIIGMYDL